MHGSLVVSDLSGLGWLFLSVFVIGMAWIAGTWLMGKLLSLFPSKP
jgi:hypothetical protein